MGRPSDRRAASLFARGAALLGCLALLACAGARHRKVKGPPPEYELPDEPGAREPDDGGARAEPGPPHAEGGPPGGGKTEIMLVSPR